MQGSNESGSSGSSAFARSMPRSSGCNVLTKSPQRSSSADEMPSQSTSLNLPARSNSSASSRSSDLTYRVVLEGRDVLLPSVEVDEVVALVKLVGEQVALVVAGRGLRRGVERHALVLAEQPADVVVARPDDEVARGLKAA